MKYFFLVFYFTSVLWLQAVSSRRHYASDFRQSDDESYHYKRIARMSASLFYFSLFLLNVRYVLFAKIICQV